MSAGLTGSLPSKWASGWKNITDIRIENTSLAGTIPASWGAAGAFPLLTDLDLPNLPRNNLTGGLEALGAAGYLPALDKPTLSSNLLSGKA